MTKHLRTVKASIIMGIFLVCIIASFSAPVSAREKAISFPSYIDFDYDVTSLNEPLEIDVSVTIPITVKYWTDIPNIFRKIPFPFNYLILFGQPIGPMQKIHLEILNPPDWANVYISTPDVLIDIPFDGEEIIEMETNLILSPRVEAPAESYRIDIKATCESMKRLSGFSYQESIEFTPSFIPTIQISPEKPIRTVGPHETVIFQIYVQNLGNKITRVTPTLKGVDSKWTATINPPQYEIAPNKEKTFTFSMITPYDFGWHNEYGRFEIELLSEVYPYRSSAASHTQSIYLVVNNHGFSTPGFEFPILIMTLIGLCIIIKKRQSK